MGTLANSEDQNVAFHQCLHCLLRQIQTSGTEAHSYLEISTCNPFKGTMDNLILIVFICMGESIRIQRAKQNIFLFIT